MRQWLVAFVGLAWACGGGNGDAPTPEDLVIGNLSWAPNEDYFGPITATWQQTDDAPVRVEYMVDDEWQSTREIAAVAGVNEATIVGIPLGTTSPWRIVTAGGLVQVDAATPIEQRQPNRNMPLPEIDTSVPDRWEPTANYIMVSINQDRCSWCPGTYWLMIIDRLGRPVWATKTRPGHWILYAQISKSGDSILWDDINEEPDSVANRTYLDEWIEEIDVPGHHHAMIELDDGTIAWGSGSWQTYTESIMELAPGATAPSELWRCDQDWPALDLDHSYGGYTWSGCFGSNSLWYDPASDAYQYSWYSVESLVEIDRSTGESSWWSQSDWLGTQGLDREFTFDPPDSRFRWQHGVEILPDGHLLISSDDADSTVVREYEIDRTNKILRQVWSFDPGILADYNGDTRRLANGNTLHGLGAASVLYEVTPDGTVVWQATFQRNKMIGRADLIEDLYDLVAPRD